jgi:hypothetical protein
VEGATSQHTYSEIRQYLEKRGSDPDFAAQLPQLVRSNINVAAAINDAPGFLSGLSEDRKSSLMLTALAAFAPDDLATIIAAREVSNETGHMEKALSMCNRPV